MKLYIIAMPSITAAQKAQNALLAAGYTCRIARTYGSSSSGCGFSVRVSGDIGNILRILRDNKIESLNYSEG